MRVALLDQLDLPGAKPFLEALFVGDAGVDGVAAFGPDEAVQTVAAAEVRAGAGAMLLDTRVEVGRDADIRGCRDSGPP